MFHRDPAPERTTGFPFRRLPLKVLYRGLELSEDVWDLLDEAMVRLDTDDPNDVLKAALALFLEQPKNRED
jgi:hypothetical protein